jgi:hypothetical protein
MMWRGEQHDQVLDLRFAVGVPEPPAGAIAEPRVDDLDANGTGVEPGPALPLAVAGMPGTVLLVHQLVDGGGLVIADQVVAADLAMGQQGQGALQRCRGVVDDDELGALIVIDRRVAGVDARAAGAAGEDQQGEGKNKKFHGKRQYAEDDNATV